MSPEPGGGAQRRRPTIKEWHVTLICLTLAAAVLAPYASQLHDGLEAVAERLGLAVEEPSVNPAPLPDYSLPGESSGKAGQYLAVVIGMLAVFALTYGVGKALARRPPSNEPDRADSDATGSSLPVAPGEGDVEGEEH